VTGDGQTHSHTAPEFQLSSYAMTQTVAASSRLFTRICACAYQAGGEAYGSYPSGCIPFQRGIPISTLSLRKSPTSASLGSRRGSSL